MNVNGQDYCIMHKGFCTFNCYKECPMVGVENEENEDE